MRYKRTKVAAVIALAFVLTGAVGLGRGSVAFSQVGQAVSSTLDRLKELIMAIRTEEPPAPAPLPTADSDNGADEQTPASSVRAIMCAARFFFVPQNQQAVWQSLKDQGIELVRASTAPETYYATLSQDEAERFEGALTVGPITSPRVMVGEGNEAMIATDVFALAWLPTISSDGRRIESSFSFHDGENGFEIPNVSNEDDGAVLVRVKGIIPTGEDILILLNVGYP